MSCCRFGLTCVFLGRILSSLHNLSKTLSDVSHNSHLPVPNPRVSPPATMTVLIQSVAVKECVCVWSVILLPSTLQSPLLTKKESPSLWGFATVSSPPLLPGDTGASQQSPLFLSDTQGDHRPLTPCHMTS